MKPSIEYFDGSAPFNEQDDASLLNGVEQLIAVCAESELFGIGLLITAERDRHGAAVVALHARGDDMWTAPTLREALRKMLNEG